MGHDHFCLICCNPVGLNWGPVDGVPLKVSKYWEVARAVNLEGEPLPLGTGLDLDVYQIRLLSRDEESQYDHAKNEEMQEENKLWCSLKDAWHVIPDVDFKREGHPFPDKSNITAIDWGEDAHDVPFPQRLLWTRQEIVLYIKKFIKALNLTTRNYGMTLQRNFSEHSPQISHIWAFAIPDATAFTSEEEGKPFEANVEDVTQSQWGQKLAKEDIDSAENSETWSRWVHNTYWFLETMFAKTTSSGLILKRSAQKARSLL
ncbi:hypothetical protein HDU97_002790, partial [Phlyctochytrium planicorne]